MRLSLFLWGKVWSNRNTSKQVIHLTSCAIKIEKSLKMRQRNSKILKGHAFYISNKRIRVYQDPCARFIFAIIRSAKIRIIVMYCKIPQYPKHWRHSWTKQKGRLQKCQYYMKWEDAICADVHRQMQFRYKF